MKKKEFKKLKRLELVQLIYELRKDNIAQRKRCEELEKQLKRTEELLRESANRPEGEALLRIESLLVEIYRNQRGEAPDR